MESQYVKSYSKKWQERFSFFEQYGDPGSKEYKEAFKKESFSRRIKLGGNFFAFFFGSIYFFVLGLWRKGLTLLAIVFVAGFVLGIVDCLLASPLPPVVWRMFGLFVSFQYMALANYAYYLKEVKGDNSWNPYKGFTFFSKKS